MSDSIKERLARIETQTESIQRNVSALFELHNSKIAPAISKVDALEADIKDHSKNHWRWRTLFLAIATALIGLKDWLKGN